MSLFNTQAMQLTQQALWLVLKLSAPAVLAAAVVGLAIAFIQAATQLQEQTFQYAIKFFVITLVLMLTGTLLGASLVQYSEHIFLNFAGLIRS
jgi:type III secretion protein S